MRLHNFLWVLSVSQSAVAGPVKRDGALSEEQIVNALIKNPSLVPPEVHKRIVQKHNAGVLLQKRQIANTGSFLETIQNYGSLILSIPSMIWSGSTSPNTGTEPKSLVPEIQVSKGIKFTEAKRVKIRYGPFRIPSINERNLNFLMYNVEGISTSFQMNVRRPCEEECTILGIQADLEYADGSQANNSNGAVFHHTVLLNAGPNVVEPTCSQPFLENIFMSGNEKGTTDYAVPGGRKSGYSVGAHDTFSLNTELQNFSNKEKYVWETITYEIVDGSNREYTPAKIVWLTIGTQENPSIALCHYLNGEFPWGPSNLTGRDQPMVSRFSEHSRIWRSDKDAVILQAAGHLHDGGINVEIYQNGERFCDSKAKYALGPAPHIHGPKPPIRSTLESKENIEEGFKNKRQITGGQLSNTEIPHIVGLERCNFPQGRPLRPGDSLYIAANYDLDAHPGVKDSNGKVDMIMGMAGVLVSSKEV